VSGFWAGFFCGVAYGVLGVSYVVWGVVTRRPGFDDADDDEMRVKLALLRTGLVERLQARIIGGGGPSVRIEHIRKGNRFVRWAAAGVYPAVARGPEGQTGSKTGQEAPLAAQKVADTERTVEEDTHAHDPGIKSWEAAEWKTRPLPNPTIAASRISASTIPVHASDDPDRGRYAGLDRGEPMQRGEGE